MHTVQYTPWGVRVSLKKSDYFFGISQKWFDFDTQSVPGALETTYRHSNRAESFCRGPGDRSNPKNLKKSKSKLYEQLRYVEELENGRHPSNKCT